MSFLGDLVNSIGSDKAPVPPPKPFQRQTISSSVAAPRPLTKPAPQLTQNTLPPTNGLKRKAEGTDGEIPGGSVKISSSTTGLTKNNSRPSTPTAISAKLATSSLSNNQKAPSSTAPGKAPPKGSYADIMARAKQAQEQRSTSQVGMIKHQATSKEKTSKLAERRREEQERLKNGKSKPDRSSASATKVSKKRSPSPARKDDQARTPKAPRPPLHAPSGYKGTMGTAPKISGGHAAGRASKRSRYDEYLGTDEEDNSDMEDHDDGYGYGSDASSDMEAGLDELETEEATALRVARDDDAKELAIENRLKQEKEERRRKLAAMARRGR